MNRWARVRGLAGILAVTASACIPDIQRPDVRLAGARLGGFGLEGGLLYVDLSVTNPNPFVLAADQLSYDVDLRDPGTADDEWIDVTDGIFEEDFGVAANDSAVVTIPVEFTYSGVGTLVQSIVNTGTFVYRVRGTVILEEPLRTEIPYDREGTLTVLENR